MKCHFVFLFVAVAFIASACGNDADSAITPAAAASTTSPPTSPTTDASSSESEAPDTAPPASDTPTVIFDGQSCSYSGPTEFELNTLPPFVGRNTGTIDYNFVMLAIDAALGEQEAVDMVTGFRGLGPELPSGITERSASGIIRAGQDQRFNAAFTASGNYLPACETFPDPVWFAAQGFVTVP